MLSLIVLLLVATMMQAFTKPSLPISSLDPIKKTLAREYASFFNPLERSIYSPTLDFTDPLASLNSITDYEKNIQMLNGRGLLGGILFDSASSRINLHKIVSPGIQDANIQTFWTLKFTVKLLPWRPTLVISGVSLYFIDSNNNSNNNNNDSKITRQVDYWDSINLSKSGTYSQVDKAEAVSDCIGQVFDKSKRINPSANPGELPFELLRATPAYLVYRFPARIAVSYQYEERRDEAFLALGEFCRVRKITPLVPSFIEVNKDGRKTMRWITEYKSPKLSNLEFEKTIPASDDESFAFEYLPETVFAVKFFNDAITQNAVDSAHNRLLTLIADDETLKTDLEEGEEKRVFLQYDAVFSMGERKAAVAIELVEHVW
tara:strand:+ start:642 stop:1766 length:1125 start_codon:yes stop_codon:yes gene_type:complete